MNAIPSADQFANSDVQILRFREAGDVTLYLYLRNARIEDRWLGLHPREFALFWWLAEHPGQRMTSQQLQAGFWPIDIAPESGGIAMLMARVRAKLEAFGLACLIAAHPDGGYFLDVPAEGAVCCIAAGEPD